MRPFILLLVVGLAARANAQSAAAPAPAEFDALLTRVVNAAKEYENGFRNLVAEETKLEEILDQSGTVKKQREVVSDLLVYRSSRNAEQTAEYRDVRAVDGKAVEARSQRVLDLLSKASKSSSSRNELETIVRESRRYNLRYTVNGFTIGQPGLFLEKRGEFDVEWAGRDHVSGHEVVVIDYRDKTVSRVFDKAFSRNGATSTLMRGRLWVDEATAQLRRDRWEVLGNVPGRHDPVLLIGRESTYTESRYGILVPERIVYEFHERGKAVRNQAPPFFTIERTTCTYGAFRKFDVATQEAIGTPK
ncbi:MAG TPA: hypothetical protein VKB50_23130 [Vicinamibacterales bacterium]|nr:hypothetical protein [Vicinamibacterales bacterium]